MTEFLFYALVVAGAAAVGGGCVYLGIMIWFAKAFRW